MAHHVAQFAHCLAQGKVGSGFDVSASFHGSHRYRRFAPACLSGLIEVNIPESSLSVKHHVVQQKWKTERNQAFVFVELVRFM